MKDTAQQLQAAREFQAPAVQQPNTGLSPLVQAAMSGQLDTQKLNDLLQIQKDYEANEARKAYHRAVAAFKANAPTVRKDKTVSYGNTNYRHVSLGYALSEINPVLSRYGLSVSWKTRQEDKLIYVTCYLSHELGHSESTELFGGPDASGQKNPIQQIASAVTYLKRHTAFALLGLEAEDADDDGGAGEQVERISADQANAIHSKIEDNDLSMDAFLQWLRKSVRAESIEDIAASAYQDVTRQIDATIRARKAKAGA